MTSKLVNLGFGNMLVAKKILAIISPNSSPMKRLREDARAAGMLLDATQGRRTRSLIITDSGHVILSAVQVETMAMRYEQTGHDNQRINIHERADEE